MNDNEYNSKDNLVENTIKIYLNKINLLKKSNLMLEHIKQNILEPELKDKKIINLDKFIKDINSLGKFNLRIQQMGLILLERRWVQFVKNNGFISIKETLNNLCTLIPEFNTSIFTDKNDPLCLVDTKQFINYYLDLIKPIHIKIENNFKNLEPELSFYDIKPALQTTYGNQNGIYVQFSQNKYKLLIMGLIDNDILYVHRSKINKIKIKEELLKLKFEDNEADKYLNCISLRDCLTNETRRLINKIKNQKEKIDFYKNIDISVILCEYSFLPDISKVELITLLLEFNLIDKARGLFSKIPFSKSLLAFKYRKHLDNIKSIKFTSIDSNIDVPFETQIENLNASDKIKRKAYDKLKIINRSNDGDSKAQKYLEGLLKIPFGIIRNESELDNSIVKKELANFNTKYPEFNIEDTNRIKILKFLNQIDSNKLDKEYTNNLKNTINLSIENQIKYMDKVENILSEHIHGHQPVKTQIKRLLAKWISGGQSGMILGLEGPPGNGKTTLIKKGLANCLIDTNGESRPVGFIPLGGSCNSSTLVGHGYTYQGSTWGRIADILMDCQCMNPILLFDELDKVSNSENGKEISSILIHLTDTSQNEEFYDKYFDGIPLDLSKSLMVFTFNDRNKLDPILVDRMTIIKTEPLRLNDKLVVAKKHLIPELSKLINLSSDDIEISDGIIKELIYNYTKEAGARQLKRLLEELINELNLQMLMNPSLKLIINNKLIESVFWERDKIKDELIPSNRSLIGQINGLFANSLGLGGILPIQVSDYIGEAKFELTGTQGDTMKESMKCAKSVAYDLYIKSNSDIKIEDNKQGLHIHCPSTSIPKDGPSAGAGICLAIYSHLLNKPIYSHIAITGEIDLKGKITAIGGLEAKINGAKKAGVTKILIPTENKEHFERLIKNNHIEISNNFEIIMVENIHQCIEHVIDFNN